MADKDRKTHLQLVHLSESLPTQVRIGLKPLPKAEEEVIVPFTEEEMKTIVGWIWVLLAIIMVAGALTFID